LAGAITVMVLGSAVLYRYAPCHPTPAWRWLNPGSLVARPCLDRRLGPAAGIAKNVASYDAAYGSVGAVIGPMIWMWMSAIIILLGPNCSRRRPAFGAEGRRPSPAAGLPFHLICGL
jgi:membrane protein